MTIKVVYNMKRFLFVALCLFCYAATAFSQSANALYLKDGSRIIGHVLEVDSETNSVGNIMTRNCPIRTMRNTLMMTCIMPMR